MTTSPTPPGVSPDGPFVPFHTTQLNGRRVLVLAPHQDDEALGCGGAVIRHVDSGDAVKVVFLTDGGGGDVRQEYQRDAYVVLREREARHAAAVLGVADLEFWAFADGALATDGEPLERLAGLLREYQPGLVYAPSPIEFHPDHRATAALLWRALQHLAPAPDVAFYEINRPLQVNTLIDVTDVVDRKRRACDVYVSQLANYPYTECILGLNRYRALTVAPACSWAEGYFVMAGSEVAGRRIEAFAAGQHRSPVAAGGETPLISMIVRTRDRPTRLREALASIQAQSFRDMEVVVVNDGGEDVSPVVSEWNDRLNIRVAAHASPRGRAAAANSGLRLARGKYVGFVDDDDRLYPEHVGKLAAHLEATGEPAAYSDCECGRYVWNGREFVLTGRRSLYKGVDYDRDRLHFGNYIPIMTVMFQRRLIDDVGLFDESLECLEDWDFWLRLSARAPLRRLPGVTSEYRVFGEPSHDWQRWQPVVLRKHAAYWTVENIARVWPRIEAAFEDREARLADALHDERHERAEEIRALRAELELLRGSLALRLARRVRSVLPDGAVRALRRLMAE